MIIDAPAIQHAITELHQRAPQLIDILQGPVDREDLPEQLAEVGRLMRGFRVGLWTFDLLGEGMVVDPGLPVNGAAATYHAILDTRGNGVYFVHVERDGSAGAVLCFTAEQEIFYAAPTLLDFLAGAAAAAASSLEALEAEEQASPGPELLDLELELSEEFADRYLSPLSVLVPGPIAAAADPLLAAIAEQYPGALVADLRHVEGRVVVPFQPVFDRWGAEHTKLVRLHGGQVVVAHRI